MRYLLLFCLLANPYRPITTEDSLQPELKLAGLLIWVDDLQTASHFYTDILGFQTTKAKSGVIALTLKNQGMSLYLAQAKKKVQTDYAQEARTSLAIEVPKLLPAIDFLRKTGIQFEDHHLERNGVGISIPFHDPAGNLLHLMEVQTRKVPPFEGFRIYNTGITSSNMDTARKFYTEILGFEAWSFDYLPSALPLKHHDDSFAFMLHEKSGLSEREHTYGTTNDLQLVFHCNDLLSTEKALKTRGIEAMPGKNKQGLIYQDPFGNIIHVWKN